MDRVQSNTPAAGNTPTRADARAAQQRRRSLILLGVILVLAVALAIVLFIFFARGPAAEPEQEPSASGECLPSSLRITADPAIAGALEAIVADLTGARADCPDVTIVAEDSAVTAATLAAGSAPEFDVWVPDSAMWPARATGQAERTGVDAADLVVGADVASTPVVFAATEADGDRSRGRGRRLLEPGGSGRSPPCCRIRRRSPRAPPRCSLCRPRSAEMRACSPRSRSASMPASSPPPPMRLPRHPPRRRRPSR